jgi:RNA methyltransferase, TrmH family
MKITSIKDPIIVGARNLQSSSNRKALGKALLYGVEQINWAIKNSVEIEFIFTSSKERGRTFSTISTDKIIEVSEGILKKISGTNYLVPSMAIAKINQSKLITSDFVVVLDGLQDFGNIGSIVRTSQGFSINEFMFVNMQSDPFARKVIDSSRGTVFNSKISEYCNDESAVNALKEQGYQIIVTSPHAKNLQSQAPLQNKKIALVVGNETTGASQTFIDSADIAIQIPMNIVVESLNVSVSAGISIYEFKFKQVVIMLKEKIFSNLGRQIGVTGKLIRAAFDREISSCTDLSGMQVILMMIMRMDQTMSLDQISKDIALFGADLQAFISTLELKNYIAKNGETYSLTEKGAEFLAEIWPIVDRTHQKILAELSELEIEQLYNLLSKIQNGCNKILEPENDR